MEHDQAAKWISDYLSRAKADGRRSVTFGEIRIALPEEIAESVGESISEIIRETAETMGFIIDPAFAGFTEVGIGQSVTYTVRIDPE